MPCRSQERHHDLASTSCLHAPSRIEFVSVAGNEITSAVQTRASAKRIPKSNNTNRIKLDINHVRLCKARPPVLIRTPCLLAKRKCQYTKNDEFRFFLQIMGVPEYFNIESFYITIFYSSAWHWCAGLGTCDADKGVNVSSAEQVAEGKIWPLPLHSIHLLRC